MRLPSSRPPPLAVSCARETAGGSSNACRMVYACTGTPGPPSDDEVLANRMEANQMIRVILLITCSLVTTVSHAALMQCDDARECSLVCYFPSGSARTEPVYPVNAVAVNRVQVEAVGDHNLLYTSQRIDRTGTTPTFHPLEAFILPKDYPCRLSPVEHGEGGAASNISSPNVGRGGTGTD